MDMLKTAAVLAAASTTGVAAQSTVLQYEGRVTAIVDELGIFDGVSLGLAASGSAVVDLEAEDLVIDIAGADQIGAFPILSLDSSVADQVYTGESPAALVLDNVFSNDFPGTDPIDLLLFGAFIGQSDADDTYLGFDFQGSDDLFTTAGIDNVTRLDLSNLEFAEVTIEFRNFNDDDTFQTSRLTIEVLTLSVNGTGGITLTCLPDTNENGEVDFGDYSTWIALFNAGDYRADMNRDGEVTPADFGAWVAEYNSGC